MAESDNFNCAFQVGCYSNLTKPVDWNSLQLYLIKKFPFFYGTHYCGSTIRQFNSVHSVLTWLWLSDIFSYQQSSFQVIHSFQIFWMKFCIHFVVLPHVHHTYACHAAWFDYSWSIQIVKLVNFFIFLSLPFSLFEMDIFLLSILFSDTAVCWWLIFFSAVLFGRYLDLEMLLLADLWVPEQACCRTRTCQESFICGCLQPLQENI